MWNRVSTTGWNHIAQKEHNWVASSDTLTQSQQRWRRASHRRVDSSDLAPTPRKNTTGWLQPITRLCTRASFCRFQYAPLIKVHLGQKTPANWPIVTSTLHIPGRVNALHYSSSETRLSGTLEYNSILLL